MSKRVIDCPHCHAAGAVDLEKAKGETLSIRCPRCGKSFDTLKELRYNFRKVPLPKVRIGPFGYEFDHLPRKGTLMDISSSGMRIKIAGSAPDPGEALNFEFKLPPTYETIRTSGKVMWVKAADALAHEFGVEFVGLEPHSQKLIGFFLLPN